MSCSIQDSPHPCSTLSDNPATAENFDLGIPEDYIPLFEPKPYHFSMMSSIMRCFKEAISSDFSTEDLLELIRDTSRPLVSMRLPLASWKTYALSLLHVWRDKEQKSLDEAGVIRQRISTVDSSISSSVDCCTVLAREKTALGVRLTEVADKASVLEQELIEYKAKVKQASDDLENYTLLLGTLEQTKVDKVAEHAREEEALALARATLADLKTCLDNYCTSQDNTFLAEYKAILDDFIP